MIMKIYEVSDRNSHLESALLSIWKESVRATHLFLSDSEIEKIKEYVPQAIGEVEHLVAVEDDCGGLLGLWGRLQIGWKCSFCLPIKEDRG